MFDSDKSVDAVKGRGDHSDFHESLKRLKKQNSEIRVVKRRELFTRSKREHLTDTGVFLVSGLLMLAGFFAVLQMEKGQTLKKEVLGTATTGFEFFNTGRDQFRRNDLSGAAQKFTLAGEEFEKARSLILESSGVLNELVKLTPRGQDAERLLEAGRNVSRALPRLLSGIGIVQTARIEWNPESNSSGRGFFEALQSSRQEFIRARTELTGAVLLLREVNPNFLPDEYRNQFITAGGQLTSVSQVLDQFVDFQTLFLKLLGGEPKRYLILFQNNDELRATGGFIGTYGVLIFENGTVRIDRIESVYALDGQLKQKTAPPLPLTHFLTDEWGLRDSNWFADFTVNARKAMDFYEQGTGLPADGVITMTPETVEDLLRLTGPVEMDDYGEVLTAENFRERVQYKTSLDYDRQENRPKKFLSDFAPRFLTKLMGLDKNQQLEALTVLGQELRRKNILMYSVNPDIQELIERLDLDGRIEKTSGDYLAVFHSSLGGGKTNQNISDEIEKTVTVDESGRAVVELVITRTHEDYGEQFFPVNRDFMRILVPFGSRLLAASGFKTLALGRPERLRGELVQDPEVAVWEEGLSSEQGIFVGFEAGYTEFAGWQELSPGERKSVKLVYELPFAVNSTYTQLLQKQPGSGRVIFSLQLNRPGRTVFAYPESWLKTPSGLRVIEEVSSDRFYSVVVE